MGNNLEPEPSANLEFWSSQEILQTSISWLSDAITVQDFEGRILAWNPAAEALYGYHESEALGRDILDFTPVARHHEMRSWIAQLRHDQTLMSVETQRISKDGRLFHTRLTAGTVHDAHQTPRAIVTIEQEVIAPEDGRGEHTIAQEELQQRATRKVLHLMQANQELIADKQMFQVTLDCIGDAVITTDKQGKITYLNPVAEVLSGWTKDEALGRPSRELFRIINEVTRTPVEDPVASCLLSGEVTRLSSDTLLIRRDGDELSIDDTVAPIFNTAKKVVGAVLVFRDVTEKRRLVQQLRSQAVEDALTGLENRRGFERALKNLLNTPNRLPGALLYLDLDQFKIVNDTGGHAAGDALLSQIGALMRPQIRAGDKLSRLGGDEFGILLRDCPKEQALRIANRLRDTIQNFFFEWDGKIFTIGVSIGLVPIQPSTGTLSSLLIAADAACYAAKERGGNRVHVYELDDTSMLQRKGEMEWVGRINDALRNNRFCLYFQPIVPIAPNASYRPWGEILLRLLDENVNVILPNQFTPAAERFGIMTAVDRWVFRHSLDSLRSQASPQAIYSINISGQSLSDETFLPFLVEEFRRTNVNPSQVCLEITETAAIANISCAMRFISALKELGCLFALDDFGTGLSSFAYLRSLSVDYIKVAGRFVKNMAADPIDHAMVESIHHLARVMGIKTIAEHVEDHTTLSYLKTVGIEYAQGNILGSPRALSTKAAGAF